MAARGRPASPRRMRITRWTTSRVERWRPNKVTPPTDVTLLVVEGEWEHGQRQRIQLPFLTSDVPQLTNDLLASAGSSSVGSDDVGQAARPEGGPCAPGRQPSPPPPGPAPVGAEDGHPNPGRIPPALEAAVAELLDRGFGDRLSRNAYLAPVLRRCQVGDWRDLPVAELSRLANQLAALFPGTTSPPL